MADKYRFAIDRGGTFTDIYAECPGDKVRVLKLLSEDPDNYPDAPREGIRRIIEETSGLSMPKDEPVDDTMIEWIRMGTTVATNALLERQGEREALAITAGFRDLLHIGKQARPRIFDLEIDVPGVLYEEVVEVSERLVLDPAGEVVGVTGEKLTVEKPIDESKLRADLTATFNKGIKSLAVVLMHSFLSDAHEQRVGELAREIIVPRGFTTCADAYLTPCLQRYIRSFSQGFANDLKSSQVLFMQSDGGLTPVAQFNGCRAILSGPAGGVVGYATTAYSAEDGRGVIGFDMGGTSTDVSRYAGSYEHLFESTTAGITIQAPQLDINTVAAGGGSRLFFRAGMFVVGPESAGAHPGPTCYRKGGPLTITDANVYLGRIQPAHFPHIFGETEDLPLDYEASAAGFAALTETINATLSEAKRMTPHEVALGFLRVANEAMCRPIRALTQAKGYNTTSHTLACFGGAGGQHACAIARSLGMTKVAVHKYSGILSAYGLAIADVVHEEQVPSASTLSTEVHMTLWSDFDALIHKAISKLEAQGFSRASIVIELFLNLRYKGTGCPVMTPPADSGVFRLSALSPQIMEGFASQFEKCYLREFGFVIPSRAVLIDDIRVRASATNTPTARAGLEAAADASATPTPLGTTDVYFDQGRFDCPMYTLDGVAPGQSIEGPAILIDKNSTVVLEPDCKGTFSEVGDLTVVLGDGVPQAITTELDSIHLSVFGHRFMSIAEEMGRALQRTSISVNIKERLDFSCALFSPNGGLIANAPHIPVHLGAMQETVRYQIENRKGDINPGDVLVSNHPAAGGSHLPDITVMTPVFTAGQTTPTFFVASRGHHADIGGITPGSMPPHSKTLVQEGAAFKSFKLVEGEEFQEDGITAILMEPGKIEGSSGTRNLSDNLAGRVYPLRRPMCMLTCGHLMTSHNVKDLRAQVAANQRGIVLVTELIDECGLDVVLAYMQHIQENAEVAVREMLMERAAKVEQDEGLVDGKAVLSAVDYLDDGSPICLKISITPSTGDATFDFEGTGDEIFGNLNAPRAVTYSAIIYCLRCMLGFDIPLNQGCLLPITIDIPHGCLLYPSDEAAVVGGNVLTSQRVTDVVLKAFAACAASSGCMNNITFGDATVGYYETVCGGAGAGPTWAGRSGVHTHMTNTRITDPEALERQYPVVLESFMLRDGSGGKGQYNGGDGVIRKMRSEANISCVSKINSD